MTDQAPKLYYLTRSYPGYISTGGGTIMRKAAVDQLKQNGFDVWVICPDIKSKQIVVNQLDQIITIPFNQKKYKLYKLLQHVGFLADYMDSWAKATIKYLAPLIKSHDLIFSTTGGGLATIKAGSVLSKMSKGKFIVNYRDPINHAKYDELRVKSVLPHVNRDHIEKKYISNADLIITSCQTFCDVLKTKYPLLTSKIKNNSFGYIDPIAVTAQIDPTNNDKLNILYGGMFSTAQQPQRLISIVNSQKFPKPVHLYFVGNFTEADKENNESDHVHFLKSMPRDKFCEYASNNAHVGFVSLYEDYYKYCLPSKVYENINLELPMLGSLPAGNQGFDIINKYGICANSKDPDEISKAITELCNDHFYQSKKSQIIKDKFSWSMENRIKEVVAWLRSLPK